MIGTVLGDCIRFQFFWGLFKKKSPKTLRVVRLCHLEPLGHGPKGFLERQSRVAAEGRFGDFFLKSPKKAAAFLFFSFFS
jgi:hypothetical protein